MMFEYKYETISLSEEQQQMVDLGFVKQESVNDMILEMINEEAQDGWEPLYPFSFPSMWFKRALDSKNTTKTTDKED